MQASVSAAAVWRRGTPPDQQRLGETDTAQVHTFGREARTEGIPPDLQRHEAAAGQASKTPTEGGGLAARGGVEQALTEGTPPDQQRLDDAGAAQGLVARPEAEDLRLHVDRDLQAQAVDGSYVRAAAGAADVSRQAWSGLAEKAGPARTAPKTARRQRNGPEGLVEGARLGVHSFGFVVGRPTLGRRGRV